MYAITDHSIKWSLGIVETLLKSVKNLQYTGNVSNISKGLSK